MKRIISLVLIVLIFITNINFNSMSTFANEESNHKIVYINANVNGIPRNLPAIQNESGNLFLSGKTLSEITVYQNEDDVYTFRHDKSQSTTDYRRIVILDTEELKIAQLITYSSYIPKFAKSIELPDIITYNNNKYFPIVEMLPLLNAHTIIENNCLYIEDVPYSLSNIMPEFEISDYMFNMYNDNDFLGLSNAQIISGWSYLFNGLVDFELKKFVPIIGTRLHKIEAYEEIFTSYLAEDETYFEAIGDEEHVAVPMINYLLDDDSERINTVIEGMEAVNDIIKDYKGYDISSEDIKMIKSSATFGKQLEHAINLYSFAAIYTDHVTDHYEMLDAIYGLDYSDLKNNKVGWQEEAYTAAKNIYYMYSDDQKQAIANYIGKQIEDKIKDLIEDGIKEGISEELSLGHAFALSKLASSVIKAYFIAIDLPVYNIARKCENLSYYNKLMESGVSQFWTYNNAYDNISKDNIEKARLSTIFALLSSRSMYQALLDSEKAYDNTGGVYQRKIDSINEMLKNFYLAKNCCLTDSEEYIDERINSLNQNIANLELLDSESNYFSIESQLEGVDSETLQTYARYFYSHYDEENCSVFLADFTHDGIKEMIVVSRETGEYQGAKLLYHSDLYVYEIQNNRIYQIYEEFTDSSHVGNKGFSLISIDGKDYIIEYAPWVYQGEATYSARVFNLNGENNEIIELCNSNNLLFVVDEEREDYDPIIAEEETQKFYNFLREYLQNAKTLCNNSGITVSDYNSIADDLFTISAASDIFKGVSMENIDFSDVSIKVNATTTAKEGLVLRAEATTNAQQITSIPFNSTLTILSVSDDYQDGNWEHQMVEVEYNGQKGYVHTDYLLIDTQIDMSQYSINEKFVVCMLLYNMDHDLYDRFKRLGGLFDYTSTNEYTSDYVKLLPQGLTINQLKQDFSKYFSKKMTDEFEGNYIEKDGYLWMMVGYGGPPVTAYTEVVDLVEVSDNEIHCTIIRHYWEEMWEYEGVQSEESFKLIFEDGRWKCDEIVCFML